MTISKSRENLIMPELIIAPETYTGKTCTAFIGGVIPVRFISEMEQEDFNKLVDGNLTNDDIIRLKMKGLI